jgi:hypothetical protein
LDSDDLVEKGSMVNNNSPEQFRGIIEAFLKNRIA